MCDDCKIWFQQKTGKAAPIAAARPKPTPQAEDSTANQTQQTAPQGQPKPPVVNRNSSAGKAVDTKKLGTGLAAVIVVLLVVLVVGKVVSSRGNKTSTGDVEVAQDNNSDDGDDGGDGDYYDTETESYDEEGDYVEDDYDEDLDEEESDEEESEFIFPNSDSEYLTEDDLEGLSAWELRIGRNEIMARHGRRFNDESLQEYFDSCSWYEGTLEPEEFDSQYDSILNKYEKKNANTIKAYENQ
jgi:hypothetical protein